MISLLFLQILFVDFIYFCNISFLKRMKGNTIAQYLFYFSKRNIIIRDECSPLINHTKNDPFKIISILPIVLPSAVNNRYGRAYTVKTTLPLGCASFSFSKCFVYFVKWKRLSYVNSYIVLNIPIFTI